MNLLRSNKLVLLYAFFIAAYLALTFITPIDKETLVKYSLDTTQARLLSLTIVIPYVTIWLIALVGYLRLRTYVDLIAKSNDGAAFKLIWLGILWLCLWLPLSTLVDGLTQYLNAMYPSGIANFVRIDNYIRLALIFPGFWLTYLGSKMLLPLVKKPTFSPPQALYFGYLAFATLYVLLTLKDTTRQVATEAVTAATYYLPDWLIVTTLVIPRLIMWFLGVQAVYNIYVYSKNVKGNLYRTALSSLAFGLGGVVIMTVALRCLQSLSGVLSDLSIGFLLAFLYLLLSAISVGYILIAKGAKSLQKLEEL